MNWEPVDPSRPLLDDLDTLAQIRGLKRGSVKSYSQAIRRLGTHLGRAPVRSDLDSEISTTWIAAERPEARRRLSENLAPVWNWLASLGFVRSGPRPRPRAHYRPLEATASTVQGLAAAANEISQADPKLGATLWAAAAVALDTGLRPADVLELLAMQRVGDIICYRHPATGLAAAVELSPMSAKALERVRPMATAAATLCGAEAFDPPAKELERKLLSTAVQLGATPHGLGILAKAGQKEVADGVTRKTTLKDFLALFVRDHETGISDKTVHCYYEPAIARFREFLGRSPTLGDFKDTRMNEFTIWLQERTAPATLKNRRAALLTLWRTAYRWEFVATQPGRIRRLKAQYKPVVAWSPSEVLSLVNKAREGRYKKPRLPNGLRRGYFLATLIACAWDSALRLGDLLDLKGTEVKVREDGTGFIHRVQGKTNNPISCELSPWSTAMLVELHDGELPREKVFSWPYRPEQLFKALRRLVKDAGVSGTFRFVRRGAVTAAEKLQPGLGTQIAGHRDPTIAKRHYVDPMQLGGGIKLPSLVSLARPLPKLLASVDRATLEDRLAELPGDARRAFVAYFDAGKRGAGRMP